jgi:D-sedoheptulose 7-phosphate isomerase
VGFDCTILNCLPGNTISSLRWFALDDDAFFKEYFGELGRALGSIDRREAFKAVDVLCSAYGQGKALYSMGNGGSAATASHFANEFGKCCKGLPKAGFRVQCLCDNVPQLTAFANDEGYEDCFSGQLAAVLCEGDVLFCISGSGNSPNVVRAAELAKGRKAKVIALTGFSGGRLREIADAKIHVAHDHWGRVEDAHMVLVHYLGNHVRERLR